MIAIIGILVALILPAVQSARHSARQVRCSNNLRQLGISLNHYIQAWSVLPVSGDGPYSVHSLMLPHLDQSALYHAVNFEVLLAFDEFHPDDANSTASRFSVDTFTCPANSGLPAGACGYPGNWGTGVQRYGYNGLFPFVNAPPLAPQDITDGMSQTSAFAEWVAGPTNMGERDAAKIILQTRHPLIRPDELDQFAAECGRLDPRTDPFSVSGKGTNWLRGDFKYTYYNHVMNVNKATCANAGLVQLSAWTAGSEHSRGANVTFADGHVRIIKETITLEVWRALGSRSGGEVASDAGY